MFTRWGALAILYMICPGVVPFTRARYLMHYSWHKYVPNLPDGFFYNSLALMLLSDPQLYQVSHGFHHSKVHTTEDAQFQPVGEMKKRPRINYN